MMTAEATEALEAEDPIDTRAAAREHFGVAVDASYDPSDDKIRLRASARLPPEVYTRVKAAGYGWAPKQDLFYAVWTPGREDLALELAGQDELGDEDTSLVERAADRADRFEGYSERRAADAEGARQAVEHVAQRFEFGQPILVGHHSERRARKDAERIRAGMDRTVRMWKTSEYWTDRAAGAIAHAKYKELPAVRARRIKGLEADLRKEQRDHVRAQKNVEVWTKIVSDTSLTRGGQPITLKEQVLFLAGLGQPAISYDLARQVDRDEVDPETARALVVEGSERMVEHQQRWIDHLTHRLSYERALLAESGWTPTPKPKTKSDLPILNYSGRVRYRDLYAGRDKITEEEAVGVTKAELAAVDSGYKGTRMSECRTHRIRTVTTGMLPERVRPKRDGNENTRWGSTVVYLTDSKQHPRPSAAEVEQADAERQAAENAAVRQSLAKAQDRAAAQEKAAPARGVRETAAAPFKAIEQASKAGVQVVSAPQLFPTPAPLAALMVEVADLEPGLCVLEPSAGTGALVQTVLDAVDTEVLAYEINGALCSALARRFPCHKLQVRCRDFLEVTDFQGQYPRILMNPPFERGADIKHILHAVTFLAPGGRLVALCADGPGRREAFQPLIDERGGSFLRLPDGAFREQGTNVPVAMVVINGRGAVNCGGATS